MNKIILQGYVEVSNSDLDAVMSALPKHIELSRQETGCLKFEVERDSSIPNRFNVYEEFISQEAFDAHQLRVKQSEWWQASKNASRHYTITTNKN